jgi:ATPase family AAA domain-containing protein 3A/B
MFGGGGFGGGKKDDSGPGAKALSSAADNSKDAAKSVHGFDPAALERAAKAAKDLDGSRNAKESLKLIGVQEQTKQKEFETERAKFMAHKEQLAIERIREEEQSSQRTLQRQGEQKKQMADYSDKLERERIKEQIQAQRQMQNEERQKQEESLRRQEEIRKKTLEYEAELRQQTEMAKVKAETEGRILQERKNHDIWIERKKLEAKETRETYLETAKVALSSIGSGLQSFLGDKERLTNVGMTITLTGLGLYTAKQGATIGGKYVQAYLFKPSLVRETTRSFLKVPKLKSLFSSPSPDNVLKNIVLEPKLESRLQRVAVSTANTKKNNAPFRHVLLHGPPGTGKTLFAKGLAKESGLDYAILTGGDVAPLGAEAVSEIHKVFDWANTTSNGVVLFVDEADAFLRKRSTEKISEDMRNALNAFLYRTGEANKKCMLVYASNQPEQFDWAINDRIDEMIRFDLPDTQERLRMLALYMDMYLIKPAAGSKKITVEGVDESILSHIAAETKGYSGREISKLAIAWQAAAYGTENATINVDLLLQVLGESQKSKVQKQKWLQAEELMNLTSDRVEEMPNDDAGSEKTK